MIKKILCAVMMVGALGAVSVIAAPNNSQIRVEFIENKAELDCTQEQAFFVNFYSILYANKNVQALLNIQDLSARLKKTFDEEQQSFKDGKTKWIRALDADKKVIGLVMLADQNEVLRIRRCAIDCVQRDVAAALVHFIFERYPQAKRLAILCLKENTQEIRLIKMFGFFEQPLLDASYDVARYTNFVFERPQNL